MYYQTMETFFNNYFFHYCHLLVLDHMKNQRLWPIAVSTTYVIRQWMAFSTNIGTEGMLILMPYIDN